MEYSRQILWHSSSLVDAAQPCVVSVPHPWPIAASATLPIVALLHDSLPEPTVARFIEGAFVHAAAWLPIQQQSKPAILIQPYGFGNAGWIGWGGVQLADALAHLRSEFNIETRKAGLIGTGAGATGALQLACLNPDLFDAVVATDAWCEGRLDTAAGLDVPPPWEASARLALSPVALIGNLANTRICLQTTHRATGLGGTAHRDHIAALAAALRRRNIDFALQVDLPLSFDHGSPLPANPLEVWKLLLGATGEPMGRKAAFASGISRYCIGNGIRLVTAGEPAGFASVEAAVGKSAMIRTKATTAFEMEPSPELRDASSIIVDRQTVALPAKPGRVWRFERLGKKWRASVAANPIEINGCDALRPASAVASGMSELFHRRPTIVYGTMGDDRENLVLKQLAEAIKHRFEQGVDSLHCHPCDRRVTLEIPVAADTTAVELPLDALDAIVLGTPRNNLLLAKLDGALPIDWRFDADGGEESSDHVAIAFAGHALDGPNDALVAMLDSPAARNRKLLVMTATSETGYLDAAKIRLAQGPAYIALRSGRPFAWSHRISPDSLQAKATNSRTAIPPPVAAK